MADIEQFDNPREDIKAAIRAYALEDGAYRIGLRAMNEGEWRRSAISAPARESLRQKQTSLPETLILFVFLQMRLPCIKARLIRMLRF